MIPLLVRWLLVVPLILLPLRMQSHLGWLGLYLAVAWLETRWVIDITHRLWSRHVWRLRVLEILLLQARWLILLLGAVETYLTLAHAHWLRHVISIAHWSGKDLGSWILDPIWPNILVRISNIWRNRLFLNLWLPRFRHDLFLRGFLLVVLWLLYGLEFKISFCVWDMIVWRCWGYVLLLSSSISRNWLSLCRRQPCLTFLISSRILIIGLILLFQKGWALFRKRLSWCCTSLILFDHSHKQVRVLSDTHLADRFIILVQVSTAFVHS